MKISGKVAIYRTCMSLNIPSGVESTPKEASVTSEELCSAKGLESDIHVTDKFNLERLSL